jgi:hypothetical protein
MPDEPVGALLGRWGDGEAFLIGEGGEFDADTDGTLFLRLNDSYGNGDNRGGYLAITSIAN